MSYRNRFFDKLLKTKRKGEEKNRFLHFFFSEDKKIIERHSFSRSFRKLNNKKIMRIIKEI